MKMKDDLIKKVLESIMSGKGPLGDKLKEKMRNKKGGMIVVEIEEDEDEYEDDYEEGETSSHNKLLSRLKKKAKKGKK